MACEPKNLSVLAYANGFTLWHYVTDDVAACIDPAYWHHKFMSETLRRGDRIYVCCDNGAVDVVCAGIEHGKPESVRIMVMTSCWYGQQAGKAGE